MSARAGTRVVADGTFDRPPYQFLDAGKPAGLDVEIFEAAAQAAGLEPEILAVETSETETRTADVLLGSAYSVLGSTHIATLPYLKCDHTLFANDRSLVRGIEDLRAKQIVVIASNATLIDYLKRHGYGDQLTLSSSPAEALSLVANDRAEVALLDTVVGKQALDKLSALESTIRIVESGIAPSERTFATAVNSRDLVEKLEEGLRTTIRTGQYDRTLAKYLGATAHANQVTFGSANSIMTTAPVVFGILVGVAGLLLALRFSTFQGRAINRLKDLESKLASETESQQELRLALARQQFVINRMSTSNLVDVIMEASRK
ncbi:MAG: transporter substrate-binding domain-containing protein [Verrucomicrobiales bacterium]